MDSFKKVTALEGRKALTLFDEFKNFAFKGNVIDLAVGVIIGAAFGKIISSLVDNIIMPVIGLVLPNPKGYAGLVLEIGEKRVPYGQFLADVVTFLIVAATLFLFTVKFLGWVMRTRREEAVAAPPLTKQEELLTEIRDLLAKGVASTAPKANLPARHLEAENQT